MKHSTKRRLAAHAKRIAARRRKELAKAKSDDARDRVRAAWVIPPHARAR
jgi:hypothetical protein